jgi:hypothetical protein
MPLRSTRWLVCLTAMLSVLPAFQGAHLFCGRGLYSASAVEVQQNENRASCSSCCCQTESGNEHHDSSTREKREGQPQCTGCEDSPQPYGCPPGSVCDRSTGPLDLPVRPSSASTDTSYVCVVVSPMCPDKQHSPAEGRPDAAGTPMSALKVCVSLCRFLT